MADTLPVVYSQPPDTATVAVDKGFDVLKSLVTSDVFAMVGGVSLCELLQNIMLRDYYPAHSEVIMLPDGTRFYKYIPEQPRQMLLSQPLSTTMETVIIGATVLKAVAGDAGGIATVLNLVKGFIK